MPEPRTEPRAPAALLLAGALRTFSVTLMLAIPLVLLVIMLAGLFGEEVLRYGDAARAVDRASRSTAGVMLAAVPVAVPLMAFSGLLRQLALARFLGSLSEGTTADRAAVVQRSVVEGRGPVAAGAFTPSVIVSWSLAGLALLALAAVAAFTDDDERREWGDTALLVSAAIAGVFVLLAVLLPRWARRWTEGTLPGIRAYVSEGERAAKPVRRGRPAQTGEQTGERTGEQTGAAGRSWVSRVVTAGLVLATGGGALVILAVLIRKPGKYARARHFDEAGETGILILMAVAETLVVLGLVVLLAGLMASLIRDLAEVRAALRNGGAPAERRPRVLEAWRNLALAPSVVLTVWHVAGLAALGTCLGEDGPVAAVPAVLLLWGAGALLVTAASLALDSAGPGVRNRVLNMTAARS